MRHRQAILVVAVLLLGSVLPVRADLTLPLVAPVPVPGDSLPSSRMDVVTNARTAYQSAWDKREAHDHAGAARTSDAALEAIQKALDGELDATSRRELIDIQSKLTGLRDAARDASKDSPRDAGREPARASVPDRARTETPDRGVLNAPAIEDIEPQYNAEVYRYIEYFTGAGRSVFERWLIRSGRYMTLFRDVLKKEGLPPDLVHLVFVESGFNLHARSVSAAVGPWQFLRSTGRLFGLTVNQWVDERKDPEKSTVAAARYLKHLYSIFGDWPLALASYNAGEGTVLRAIKKQGTTNYWDLRLPRQTEDYVPQFMACLAISRDPEKYGFDSVELDQPMDFDEIALKGSVDLRAIAKLADCSYEEMKALNPAVLRHATPGRDGVTMLRVPRGKGEVIITKLQKGAELPAVNLSVKHRVRRRETLQGIANQYHVSATQLARANSISRARPLKRGMILNVPASLNPPAPADLEKDDPRASTAYVPSRNIRTPASLEAESDAEGRMRHTVRKGESLSDIADKYGVTVTDIKRWNHLTGNSVKRGTRLKIRTGDAAVSSPESLAADSARVAKLVPPKARHSRSSRHIGGTVRVRPGDTLSEIATRHGTTVSRLKRANGMSSSTVRTGQRLRLPG
ncbi:MAG TPA: LysM peptidoglycan-binding domain-containing protein [Candidatus Eisenbacteria bacterium]|nr:LysM peptidoglycan-binding domain-containing protein [Candidatus Eisenbacteria bacterium]